MPRSMQVDDVTRWVQTVLADYGGLYDLQDHLFVRNAVRVVTKRRDAFFDISTDRWTSEDDAARELLRQELQRWARTNCGSTLAL